MILKIILEIWLFVAIFDILVFIHLTQENKRYLNDFFDSRNVDITLVGTSSIIPLIQIIILSAIPVVNVIFGIVCVTEYDAFIIQTSVKIAYILNIEGEISDELKEEFYRKIERDFHLNENRKNN